MLTNEELAQAQADDQGSGSREEWRSLALKLRFEVDQATDEKIRWCWAFFGGGFVVGLIAMWLVIHFHLYITQ